MCQGPEMTESRMLSGDSAMCGWNVDHEQGDCGKRVFCESVSNQICLRWISLTAV